MSDDDENCNYSSSYNPLTNKFEKIRDPIVYSATQPEQIVVESEKETEDYDIDYSNAEKADIDSGSDDGNDDFDINWSRRHLPEHWQTAGKTINAYRINPNFEDQFFGDDPMIEIIRAIEELAHQSLSASVSTPPEALTLYKSMIETPYTWTFFEDVMQYHSGLDDNKFFMAKEYLYKTGHIAKISMQYQLSKRFVLTTRPISVQHYKKGARSLL